MHRAPSTTSPTIQALFAILAIFSFLLFGSIFSASAQTSEDVSLSISPELPQADENVNAQLSSFSLDLDRVRISWRLNGATQKSGIGEKSFSFVAGKAGARTTVEATVEPSSGGAIRRSVTIQPQEVDILWHAFSYTPPFYRGAALPASEAIVKVTAMPQLVNTSGVSIAPGNLIYEWQQDGIALGNLSGFGKKSITVRAKTVSGDTTSVSVTVSSLDNKVRGQKTVTIETREPKIVLYEKHPLLGVLFGNALGDSLSLGGQEKTFRAEPYFFSLDDVAKNNLRTKWSLNREPVSNDRVDITIGGKDSSGTSQLSVNIINMGKVLQDTRTAITINF